LGSIIGFLSAILASTVPLRNRCPGLQGERRLHGLRDQGRRGRDAPVIADFNSRLAWETEEIRLDPAVIGPGVEAALADLARSRYWVAEEDGALLGQTMVTYEWSDWRNGWIWWIQSVYVTEEARNRGVFKALHASVCDAAREAGAVSVRLYVENGNSRAQEVYKRLGMHDAGYHVLEQTLIERLSHG
jgi:GNAT superfamily N-acetyltransferase